MRYNKSDCRKCKQETVFFKEILICLPLNLKKEFAIMSTV